MTLAADIDLGCGAENKWEAIGTYSPSKPFKGTFDGGGHKITGLYVDDSAEGQSLFGYLGAGGMVKSLEVTVNGKEVTLPADGKLTGLMNGTSETTFAPGLTTSRAMAATVLWQLAAILYRFAKTEGKDDTENGTDILRFSDTGDVADWAKEAMAWAVDHGIITGKGGNLLDPQGKATRAEVAAMLMRYCQGKK